MCIYIYINARAPHGKVSLRRAQIRFRLASTVYNGLGRQRVETNWDHICHLSLPQFGFHVVCPRPPHLRSTANRMARATPSRKSHLHQCTSRSTRTHPSCKVSPRRPNLENGWDRRTEATTLDQICYRSPAASTSCLPPALLNVVARSCE